MSPVKDKGVPYAKYAFLNAYNLGVLGASVTVAAATGSLWLAAVGVGAEALWMIFAPDSKVLRRTWFDSYHQAQAEAARQLEIERRISLLAPDDAARCRHLRTLREQIVQLAADNPVFAKEMIQGELAKLDQLWMSFLELSATCKRYVEYLRTVDATALDRDITRFQYAIVHGQQDVLQDLAQKNYDVLSKRRDMYAEICNDLQSTRAQVELIENTFRLLADKIVTMESSSELSTQLDDLIRGVESIRKSARETEQMMAGIERELSSR